MIRKITTYVITAAMILCLAACSYKSGDSSGKDRQPFGVFLGASSEDVDGMTGYDEVVIEPEEFDREAVGVLHDAGCYVYGYLDIGTLETYRDYYDRFSSLAMDVYDDWPDEYWVDASSSSWQSFIVNELAPRYLAMGIDGFFLDNTDVYYLYPSDNMYRGLVNILQGLKAYDAGIMVNGGNDFVMRCIEESVSDELIDAICQESVFTSIDFDNETYREQDPEDNQYYREYIEAADRSGILVRVIEYAATGEVYDRASEYYAANGFVWYNADNLRLECR